MVVMKPAIRKEDEMTRANEESGKQRKRRRYWPLCKQKKQQTKERTLPAELHKKQTDERTLAY